MIRAGKIDFDLLGHFYLKHCFNCPYDIYRANSENVKAGGQPGKYGNINFDAPDDMSSTTSI